jgi:transposase
MLARFAVEAWVQVDIALQQVEKFKQILRGRSSTNTMYRQSVLSVPPIHCSRDENAISKSQVMDEIFPFSTNADLDASAVLRAYKYPPALEKRHALLQSGLQVAPVFLKKNQRIEAPRFVSFLAQLVCALIERQLRNAMREHGLSQIQILPEDRPSATPTTEQVIRVFSSRARHLLLSKNGKLVQAFTDPLSSIQEQILDLLSIFPSV